MNNIELYEKSRHTDSGITFIGLRRVNRFPLHWHEHSEIHFLLSGEADVRVGGQIIHVKKHDCLIINSNELHEAITDEPYECFKLKLHPSVFEQNRYRFDHLVRDDTVIALMYKIIELYEHTDEAATLLVKGYVYQLAGHLCYRFAVSDDPPHIREKRQKMNLVAGYLHTNYTSDIHIEELAKLTHYNYSHFCHTFREVFGTSATQYLLSVRLHKAAALLATTTFSMTEIAERCGFCNANYFARMFKKENGCSPSEYRQSVQTKS